MKKIIFRAKSITDNRFVYGDYFRSETHSFIRANIATFGSEPVYVDFVVDKNTLGQFTGLFDKNKKAIYEGDKLRTKYYAQYVVEDLINLHLWANDQYVANPEKYLEIIGNIYEQH